MATLCKNCGGSLIYSPTEHAMFCKMCGSTFRPENVVSDSKELTEDVDAVSLSDLFGIKEKSFHEFKVYTCNTCGGDIVINDTEISTFCVYCGNPSVVFKRVSKEMKPDGIVPFSISKDEAKQLIRTRLSKRSFIPSKLKAPDLIDIKGIYVPYWVVNCDFHDAVIIAGNEKYTKNAPLRHYGKAGDCSFATLPIEASLRLNDNISKRLEPFFFDDVKVFDEDYLNGFYSDTSDLSVNDLRTAVLKRCDELFCEEVMKDISADNKRRFKSTPSVDIHEDAVYLLLPVWFYTFRYKDKLHTILVNGQTGKIVGAVPFSKRKIAATAAVTALLLFAVFCIPLLFLSGEYLAIFVAVGGPLLVTLGSTLAWNARTNIKKLNEIFQYSQSGSTFLYAKKRQVS